MAMGHEGHGPNEFTSLCRACRIGSDLQAIEAAVNAPQPPTFTVPTRKHCEIPVPGKAWCGNPTFKRCRTCRKCVCGACEPQHMEKHASRETGGRV